MIKPILKGIVFLLIISCPQMMLFPDETVEPTVVELIKHYYDKVLPLIKSSGKDFENAYLNRPDYSKIFSENGTDLSEVYKTYDAGGPLYFIIERGTNKILLLKNNPLYDYLKKNEESELQSIPELTITEVLEKAKEYLRTIEQTLPENCELDIISFNGSYNSLWEVRWKPVVKGYPYDEFLSCYLQSVAILFHEKYGFYAYASTLNFPPPKSTEVKLSKEEAIIKASQYAPFLMKTSFYRMCRAEGFKVRGVKEAVLKIAAPNWLLDPDRAIWIREKTPEETRLCWIVTFLTVDTIERKGSDGKTYKLIPPEILIYIDAATGEIVGANFT